MYSSKVPSGASFLRLGAWLGNPGPAGDKTFQLGYPHFNVGPIIAEAFGLTNDTSPHVYLEVISHGQQIDISKHLALGNVTIVDFYADWCGPCKPVEPTIQQLAKSDPEIAVRKIDIVNWASPVATQYHVSSIPRVEIYGRKGELVGTVKGADPAQ